MWSGQRKTMAAALVWWKRPKKLEKSISTANNSDERRTNLEKVAPVPHESTLPEIGIQIYYGKAKMCNVTGIFAPDESQITTWWVSFLRGGGFVQRRLQSRGSKGDKCRYAKQGGKGGNKMWNLLTHCNHQAEASGVVAVQGKSHCLPFRRTKWCFPSTVKSCVTEGGW